MFFQLNFQMVFLHCLINRLYIGYCSPPKGINNTVFLFNHPSNCESTEVYSFDNFSCLTCKSNHYLEPSFDKLSCVCAKNYETVVFYDSRLKRPVCKSCKNKRVGTCNNSATNTCKLYYINKTDEESESFQHTRIFTHKSNTFNNCTCNQKNNYIYNNYCIWKDLLKNYLNYNVYWQRGKAFANLKFVAFFCQYLKNMKSCNHLANLCVQSYFDTDKNAPCRAFFLSQASDASLYATIEEELYEFRPFLFYKKGKETIQELEKIFEFSHINGKLSMELSNVVYSLEGEILSWGPFSLNYINLCDIRRQGLYNRITFFKSFHLSCELTMDAIIDLADLFANKQFLSVFLNYTLGETRHLNTIPILISNAFDENMESNTAEWQMVKRFQLISANLSTNSILSHIHKYDNALKLRRYKNINILKKFELISSVAKENAISLPYIALSYHTLEISTNSSLNDVFKFSLSVRFEKEHESSAVIKICLPFFIIISFAMACFRSYALKCRRYIEYCDIIILKHFILNLIAFIGNSFVIVVIMDTTYYGLGLISQPEMTLITPNETLQFSKLITYTGVFLKGLYFIIFYWNTARVDVYFIDWERPKNWETSIHVKNNLDTASQCSSIRGITENNVSAWRVFFVANEWIKLSNVYMVSNIVQGFSSLTLYWLITGAYPTFKSDPNGRLIICIIIYSAVHTIQRIFKCVVLNHICGSPFKKFIDICSMTNVSVLALVDSSYGFYIHGRSPHGSADMDMHWILLQLHREAQNMCAKRGLLDDSDFQTYIILPPAKLSEQIQKLIHHKTNTEKLAQVHFQSENNFIGNQFEFKPEGSIQAYNRLNRFLCAFIDHAIKDMDYIIKEKSLIENMLSCEFNSFLTENKGIFFIDNNLTFSNIFLYGNQNDIFLMELVFLLTMDLLTTNFLVSIIVVCFYTKLFQIVYHGWVRNNIASKTFIDKRFLM